MNCYPCTFAPPVPQAAYWTPQHITVAVLAVLLAAIFLALAATLIQHALRPRPAAGLGPGAEEERGYRDQLARLDLDDTTLPRARYILAQQQAILRDTPYNQGCLRATAEYVRELEASYCGEGS